MNLDMERERMIRCASGLQIWITAGRDIITVSVHDRASHSAGDYDAGEAREMAELLQARLEKRRPWQPDVATDGRWIFSASRWSSDHVRTAWGVDRFVLYAELTNAEAADLADALRWAAAQIEPATQETDQ